MSLQHCPQSSLPDIPQTDGVVKAATGQCATIRAPDQGLHPLRMPFKCLQTASTFSVPQLDAAIPARAGNSAAVWSKGQAPHQVVMPGERLHIAIQTGLLHLPEPKCAYGVATS